MLLIQDENLPARIDPYFSNFTPMHPHSDLTIRPLSNSENDAFFRYINDHLSDNGSDQTGYFQPLSHESSRFPTDKEQSFRNGLSLSLGEHGWRRAWVATCPSGNIVGHIDLRGLPESFASHRCLLGMGVDRHHRQQGAGAMLISVAQEWAARTPNLEWIDLQVLSVNSRAISVYTKAGFVKTGETADMFRLDGSQFSYTSMSMRLRSGGTSGASGTTA